MDPNENYLKRELYKKIKEDSSIFEFIQLGSLDGIWYWDLEKSENEWMSPRFWEILGFDPTNKKHNVIEWQDLIFQDDLKVAVENLKKHCQNSNHPYDQVVRYRHKDGSTVWVRCRGMAIRDSSGKAIRLIGAHTDLTQLKQTEKKLNQKTAELEKANVSLKNAINQIRQLKEILPICMHCNKIRDESENWQAFETYISNRTGSNFSHGICQECIKEHYPQVANRANEKC